MVQHQNSGGPPDDLERYRSLRRTASPDQLVNAHARAFAQLAPYQRQQLRHALAACQADPGGDSPAALARAAAQLEQRRPGTLDRVLGVTVQGQAVLRSVASGVVAVTVIGFALGEDALGLSGGAPLLDPGSTEDLIGW